MTPRSAACLRILALALALVSSAALAQVGRVVLAVGDVAAVRGSDRIKLASGASVNAGDAVITGTASHAQIRFTDDGLVALKPDSEFRIEQYVYNGSVDGNERAVFRLVRGGFRTVTGQIGKVDHDRYSVVTTQATIGIRGTHFVLQECVADECRETPDSQPFPPGSYCGVLDGRVAADTPYGNAEYGLREYFFVPPGGAPQRLVAPPTFLADNLQGRVLVARTAPADLQFPKVPEFPQGFAVPGAPFVYMATEDLDLAPIVDSGVNYVIGSDVYTLELAAVDAAANPFTLNGAGNVVAISTPTLHASLGGASVVDTGSAPDAGGLVWGRWQGEGSTITQTLPNGQTVSNDGGNLHYIYGNAATSIPTAGVVSFSPVGSTRPTDSATGAVGTLLSGGIVTVDFTQANLALSGLSVGFGPDATYSMSGSTRLVGPLFSTAGIGANASCTGAACQPLVQGNFAGFLAGPGVTGVGLDYYFNTRPGSVIEGNVGYHRCAPNC
ncbi:MAG TPA: FecR family protein [Casimicrobiaceae bacterium]|nr:FecR family protein [Casimicrobiaceae bacterium]